ncbi:MAG: YgiT-type zinc finger protein [Tepidisphaerales bacterium]
MLNHKICPTCGSRELRLVRRTLTRTFKGRRYIVPNVHFHECPICGEQLFSPEAMDKIEGCRPKAKATA